MVKPDVKLEVWESMLDKNASIRFTTHSTMISVRDDFSVGLGMRVAT